MCLMRYYLFSIDTISCQIALRGMIVMFRNNFVLHNDDKFKHQ